MAAYFKEKGITLRFIEFMDVGSTNGWTMQSGNQTRNDSKYYRVNLT